MVSDSKSIPIAPIASKIATNILPFLATKVRSISQQEDKDILALSIINNYIKNHSVCHIYSYKTSNDAQKELKSIFQVQDATTRMYPNNKIHILKIKENEGITKYIHVFRLHLK